MSILRKVTICDSVILSGSEESPVNISEILHFVQNDNKEEIAVYDLGKYNKAINGLIAVIFINHSNQV